MASGVHPSLCSPRPLFRHADVTAIFYDEERHEIYTGNRKGTIHAWGVGFGPP